MVLVVVAALPSAPPELLVDIDTQPSIAHPPQLVGANADGMLFVQLVPEGGHALFWTSWEGPAVQLAPAAPFPNRSTAFSLGDGFIVFRSLELDRVRVEHLALTPEPRLEPLVEVSGLRAFPQTGSKTRFWWASPEGTFVTDGTPAGTRNLTSLNFPEAVIGETIYFVDRSSNLLSRWEDGGIEALGLHVPFGVVRVGDHVVIDGMNPINEAGEVLTNSQCYALGADRFGWLQCAGADAGRDLFVTDGTPAGTSLRFRGGQFLRLGTVTDERAIFSDLLDGGFITRALDRVGSSPPTPFPCEPSALLGETVVCGGAAITSLAGTELVRVRLNSLEPPTMAAAGSRALLQAPGQAQFTLSDGTRAGTRLVPDQLPSWPTESSRPKLFASDGLRALFNTTRGSWLTDGTREGTFRVGDDAEFFGHSVLAADGTFVVHGADGRQWPAPPGTIGVAGGVLVGRSGCDAFMVDEERAKTPLTGLGCVQAIEPGRDGALLRNSTNQVFLLRKGHAPYPLPGEVQLSSGVACGKEACWYLEKVGAGSFLAQRLVLASGEANTITVPLDRALPFRASDWLFASTPQWGSLFTVHPDHSRTELDFPFTITPEGRLLGVTRDGLISIDGKQRGSLRGVDGCMQALELTVTGNMVHVLCVGSSVRLFSSLLDGGTSWEPTESASAFRAPTLPTGGDVWAFSMTDPLATEGDFVMSDGERRLTTPHLVGTDFTKVRHGYVFAGTRPLATDLELWVVPDPQEEKKAEGCTCGQGSLLWSLGLVLLLRRRALRR